MFLSESRNSLDPFMLLWLQENKIKLVQKWKFSFVSAYLENA